MSLTPEEIRNLVDYLNEDSNLPSSVALVALKLEAMLPSHLPGYSDISVQAPVHFFAVLLRLFKLVNISAESRHDGWMCIPFPGVGWNTNPPSPYFC